MSKTYGPKRPDLVNFPRVPREYARNPQENGSSIPTGNQRNFSVIFRSYPVGNGVESCRKNPINSNSETTQWNVPDTTIFRRITDSGSGINSGQRRTTENGEILSNLLGASLDLNLALNFICRL
jgi:hypothetical protein